MSDYVAYRSGTPEITWHLEEDGELSWEYLTKEELFELLSDIMDPGDSFEWKVSDE